MLHLNRLFFFDWLSQDRKHHQTSCWWFRNPKQPPGMVLKPVVNTGINYRSLNWLAGFQLEVRTGTGLLFLHRPPWNPDRTYESVEDILKMSSWQSWATIFCCCLITLQVCLCIAELLVFLTMNSMQFQWRLEDLLCRIFSRRYPWHLPKAFDQSADTLCKGYRGGAFLTSKRFYKLNPISVEWWCKRKYGHFVLNDLLFLWLA